MQRNNYLKAYWIGFLWFFMLPVFASVQLTRVELINGEMTKIIFERNHTSDVHVFALSKPDRLIFDFKDTKLLANMKNLKLTNASHIKRVRFGYHKDFLRIVFDLDKPLRFKKILNDASLVVDITSEVKDHSIQTDKDEMSITRIETLVEAEEIDAMLKDLPEKKVTQTRIAKIETAEASKKIFTIVIDPGHGGKDPGAIGDLGTKEKDVTLAIAKKLEKIINRNPNMHAILTRDDDYYVSLEDRLAFARKDKADLFIAIHADSYLDTHAKGASIYSLSSYGASSATARWLAEKENYSELGGLDLDNLGDQSIQLRSVLIDMAQTQTIKDSQRYGASILDSLLRVTHLHFAKVEDAPFLVLKSPDIPSLLIETGFITNTDEEKRLRDQNHQQKLAVALYQGIRLGRFTMMTSSNDF